MCPHSNIFNFEIFFVLRENSFLFRYRRAIGKLGHKDAKRNVDFLYLTAIVNILLRELYLDETY